MSCFQHLFIRTIAFVVFFTTLGMESESIGETQAAPQEEGLVIHDYIGGELVHETSSDGLYPDASAPYEYNMELGTYQANPYLLANITRLLKEDFENFWPNHRSGPTCDDSSCSHVERPSSWMRLLRGCYASSEALGVELQGSILWDGEDESLGAQLEDNPAETERSEDPHAPEESQKEGALPDVLPEDLKNNPFEDDPLSLSEHKQPATFFTSIKAKSMQMFRRNQNIEKAQNLRVSYGNQTRRRKPIKTMNPRKRATQVTVKSGFSKDNYTRDTRNIGTSKPILTKPVIAEQQLMNRPQRKHVKQSTLRFVRNTRD